MNYEKVYAKLIESRKNRELDPDEYYELHHTWPKSLAVDEEERKLLDQEWNLIYLTPREHYIAHHLLYKICEGNDRRKMAYAFWCMCWGNENQQRKITARQYEIAKKALSESMKGENNSFYGKTHTKESKQKMSESKKGENHPMYGKTHSEETRNRMSENKLGENHPMYGKTHSEETRNRMSENHADYNGENHPLYGKSPGEETRKKLSEAKKGKNNPNYDKNLSEETKQKMSKTKKKQEKIECPHCGKIGAKANMKRYHFDNCKYKKVKQIKKE